VLKAALRKCPDRSRPLPQPLQILDGDKPILTLATVGDVRELIEKRQPEESRRKAHGSMSPDWRDAANGGYAADLSVALRIVLSLEGIACRQS
jgi:hypothetical protein